VNIYDLLDITASICPDREGFVYKDKSLSFTELRDEVLTLSQSLINLGLKTGDRVFYFHTNTIRWITITLACARIGVVLVPINYRSNPEELSFMLEDSTPKIIFAGTRYYKLISSAINKISASIINVNIEGELSDGWIDYKTLVINSDVNEIEIPDNDNNMALLVYTAGTTNTPKAVMLNHSSFCEFALNNLNPADPEFIEINLLSVPLYHVAGIQTLISGIYSGRTTVIQDQFDALDWMELVQKHKVNRVMVVPTMIKQIIDNQYFENYNFNSLKVITYGAAPMPISVLVEAIRKFDNANFINAFGQTETASTITSLGPEDHKIEGTDEEKELKLKRLSSIGKPLPDVEVKIVNENEEEVKPMIIGEIIAKGVRIMSGYWNNDEATKSVLKNGWLYTGDLGYIDLDGYIFLSGREKDFIKRGGEMISPEEIEQILYRHNSVDEVAVIGLPDDQWGEVVTAVIVTKSGIDITENEITDYCKDKLSSYKRPEKIIFENYLPRNSMGKILKKDLRKKYSDLF
jgi:acyl-CoA synthetase (AMP-forming)/AMP-acid ligase II